MSSPGMGRVISIDARFRRGIADKVRTAFGSRRLLLGGEQNSVGFFPRLPS